MEKEELKELNEFLFNELKNIEYAISENNLFYISNGELFQKTQHPRR